MKNLLLFLGLIIQIKVFAQVEKKDFLSFFPPSGWVRNTPYNSITYEDKRNVNAQYAFIQIHQGVASSGNNQINYEHFWKELITKTYQQAPPKAEITYKNGWEILTGKSQVFYQGVSYTVILQVFNGNEKTLPIFILYDKSSYQTEINKFLASIQVPKISGSTNQTQTNTNPSKTSVKITYPKTNFDDGWIALLENDFVRVSKGNLEVRIYYPDQSIFNKLPKNSNKTLENDLLEMLFRQEYNFLQFFERRKSAFSYGESDIFEAVASEKTTGKSVYLALTTFFEDGVCQPIAVISPNKDITHTNFPNYKSMEAMMAYNKFAVGKNDLLGGTWISSGASMSNYYNIYTGAFAGTSTVATTDDFIFMANDSYQSEHGIYQNGKYIKQNYKGKYSVNQWSMTATNRFNNETSEFWCEFRAIKGGVILILVNKKYTGQRFNLALQKK